MAVEKENNLDTQGAEAFWTGAIQMLQNQLKAYQGAGEKVPMVVDSSGSFSRYNVPNYM